MKPFFFLAAVSMALLLPARAADQLVTATLTVTNTPADGATLTVNGDIRTWTNSVATPATQIAQNTNSVPGNATNLYAHLAVYNFAGPIALGFASSNIVTLRGALNQAMTVTASASWASVTYATNSLSSLIGVRVPAAAEAQNVRRYVADQLVTTLQDNALSNLFSASTPALAAFVNTSESQTIGGAKTWTGAARFADIQTTNLVNRGNAISSPGSGTDSEQLGSGAQATNDLSLAVGFFALAGSSGSMAIGNSAMAFSGFGAAAVGNTAVASGEDSLAVGTSASATGLQTMAIGASAAAAGERSLVLGPNASDDGFTNTVVIGPDAIAGGDNEVVLGTGSVRVRIPGVLDGVVATNGVFHGTIGNLTGGTISSTTITGATVHATAGTLNGVTLTNAVGIHGVVTALAGGTYDGTITNTEAWATTLYGTTTIAGTTSLSPTNVSSLANGPNAGVNFGSTTFARITAGPTAAFTIAGIDGEVAGRLLVLWNATGQAMTLANGSGVEPVSAQRITTGTGADVVVSGAGSAVLVYDGTASTWLLVAYEPPTAYPAITATALANGANSLVSFSGPWVRITGPTAAFTVNSIANYESGREYTVWNTTSQNMTIAHENVAELPESRITTMTGANVTSTGACSATFRYDGTATRWILVGFQD